MTATMLESPRFGNQIPSVASTLPCPRTPPHAITPPYASTPSPTLDKFLQLSGPKLAPPVRSKDRLMSSEEWSDASWALMKEAMNESMTKTAVTRSTALKAKVASGATAFQWPVSPSSPHIPEGNTETQANTPMMAMAMIPVQAPQNYEGLEEELEEVIEEDTTQNMMGSLKQIFEAKIAERDAMWQCKIQEIQQQMSSLSIHMNTADPAIESANEQLRMQVEMLEKKIGVLMRGREKVVNANIELQTILDAKARSAESHVCLGRGLACAQQRQKEEIRELQEKLKEEYKEKQQIEQTVAESKIQCAIDAVFQGQVQLLTRERIELKEEKRRLLDGDEGYKVQIRKLEGMLSLLQVKLAESNDMRMQACFEPVIALERHLPVGRRLEDLEKMKMTCIREASEKHETKMQQVRAQLAQKEQYAQQLKMCLEASRRKELALQNQSQHEKQSCHTIIAKIKNSYEYLDTCIMSQPSVDRHRSVAFAQAWTLHETEKKDSAQAQRTQRSKSAPASKERIDSRFLQ